jgi:hypothetical protein
VAFVPHHQAPEVLQPSKQPFDFPPSSISPQTPSILSDIPSIAAMWSDDVTVKANLRIQGVGVIGVVPYQVLWGVGHHHLYQRGDSQRDLMGSGTLGANSDGESVAIGNRHNLCAFAAFCFLDLSAPFFAGAKLASINASRTSIAPWAQSCRASVVMIFVITPERTQF